MPKATLSFFLPEEQEEFETATKASEYKSALWDTGQEIFRPARKHGYSDQKIQDLLNKLDEIKTPEGYGSGTELVSLLEQKFYNLLNSKNIEL